MKTICFIALVLAMSVSQVSRAVTTGELSSERPGKVTLYSSIKYKHDLSRSFFSFTTGALTGARERGDLDYGSLYVGDEYDWFSASTERDTRSVIKDLGAKSWTDSFEVPTVEPFPKLKEGQTRSFTVDSSGADGADGVDGVPGADGDGVVRERTASRETVNPTRPKRDGRPRVDPVYVKAIVDHMYVIHVVDNDSDFYALFRVESLQSGDNCTISWKRIPSPETKAHRQ